MNLPTSRLPLHFLPTFRSAATTQNLRETAQAMNLTHSAVSQQIKALEEQLGVELFARVKRSIVLTSAGAIFLRGISCGLDEIDAAVLAARAAGGTEGDLIRMTVLPSFAQRWLLPRMGRWRAQHPELPLEVVSSAQVDDLNQLGFHAGIRTGAGQWPGVSAEPLFEHRARLILVGAPEAGRRLAGARPEMLLREPLLGDEDVWVRWAQAAELKVQRIRPAARFNDYGLMLQAVEQGLGIALVREILTVDAQADGRLVRLSEISIPPEEAHGYFVVYPPALEDWPPLLALRAWLREEMQIAHRALTG